MDFHQSRTARLLHFLMAVATITFAASDVVCAQNTTASSSSVTPTGGFSYSIPVRIPPGTAGVQPVVSLRYNSQGGNGIAGVGWNLSGVSVITRCPRTYAVDGVRGGVNIDANDRLCLDGQRLLYHSGGSGYGTGGATYFTEIFNGSKVVQVGGTASIMMVRPGQISRGGGGAIVYATAPAIPSADSRAVVVGKLGTELSATGGFTTNVTAGPLSVGTVNPDSATVRFRVFTKAGEVTEYVDAPYNMASGGSNGVRMWLLSRVSDVVGNYFDVAYTYDDVQGEYNVDKIRYTGNAGMGLAPYNEIRFAYEQRPDQSYAYLGGARLSSTKRLTSISTWYTPSGGGAITRVSQYQLSYDQSPITKRSRLRSVTESAFDAAGTAASLNPIRFAYAEDSVAPPDWGTTWNSGAMDWGFAAGRGWVEMTGSGRAGFCRHLIRHQPQQV